MFEKKSEKQKLLNYITQPHTHHKILILHVGVGIGFVKNCCGDE